MHDSYGKKKSPETKILANNNVVDIHHVHAALKKMHETSTIALEPPQEIGKDLTQPTHTRQDDTKMRVMRTKANVSLKTVRLLIVDQIEKQTKKDKRSNRRPKSAVIRSTKGTKGANSKIGRRRRHRPETAK